MCYCIMTGGDNNTVDHNEDGSDAQDVESQFDEDLGHGAHPSGGFTSVVSIHPPHRY